MPRSTGIHPVLRISRISRTNITTDGRTPNKGHIQLDKGLDKVNLAPNFPYREQTLLDALSCHHVSANRLKLQSCNFETFPLPYRISDRCVWILLGSQGKIFGRAVKYILDMLLLFLIQRTNFFCHDVVVFKHNCRQQIPVLCLEMHTSLVSTLSDHLNKMYDTTSRSTALTFPTQLCTPLGKFECTGPQGCINRRVVPS